MLKQKKIKNKILFLGLSDSPIFLWLKKKGEDVFSFQNKVSIGYIKKNGFNFLISYGYRYMRE